MVTMRHVQIGLCLLSGARCSLGGDGDGDEQDLCSVDIGGGGGEGIADPSYGLCNAEATDALDCSYVVPCSWFKWSLCLAVNPEPYLQHSHLALALA